MHSSIKTALSLCALLTCLSAQAVAAGDVAIVAYNSDGDDNFASVPEPSAYALMLAGLAAVGLVVQRRRFGA